MLQARMPRTDIEGTDSIAAHRCKNPDGGKKGVQSNIEYYVTVTEAVAKVLKERHPERVQPFILECFRQATLDVAHNTPLLMRQKNKDK